MSEKRIVAPECPHCRGATGDAIQVKAAHEWNYVTYRCSKCDWAWTVSYQAETFVERHDKPSST